MKSFFAFFAVAASFIGSLFGIHSATNISSMLATSTTSPVVVVSATSTPILAKISPLSGPVGTVVTLMGSGFTSSTMTVVNNKNAIPYSIRQPQLNSISFGSNLVVPWATTSTNGNTLTFTVPQGFSDLNKFCVPDYSYCEIGAFTHAAASGTYQIAIENVNGTSNALPFTITSPFPANSASALYAVSGVDPPQSPADGISTTTVNGFFGSDPIIKLTNTSNTSITIQPISTSPAAVVFSVPASTPAGYYYLTVYSKSDPKNISAPVNFSVLSTSRPYVTVISPGFTTYYIGSTMTVQWKGSGLSKVSATLVPPLGMSGPQYTIFSNINASVGTYTWTIPSNIPTGNYQVSISDGVINNSSESFTILSQGTSPMQAP
jgi:hypothetical protein